jgi:hypothetical protein
VNPNDEKDMEQVHALQDEITATQANGGRFEVPHWDTVSQTKIREALTALGQFLPDSRKTFGRKEDVDPVRFLIGSAIAWGGNPEEDATYLNFTPPNNDGKANYKLVVKDVPVDGFWSISVYNEKGYFEKNDEDAYTINNLTAKKGADGTVTVWFGNCDDKIVNCLPITPGWNYIVRLYRPRKAILDGTWKFPEPTEVSNKTA